MLTPGPDKRLLVAPLYGLSVAPPPATASALQLTCSSSARKHPLLLHKSSSSAPTWPPLLLIPVAPVTVPGATGTHALLLQLAGATGIFFSFSIYFFNRIFVVSTGIVSTGIWQRVGPVSTSPSSFFSTTTPVRSLSSSVPSTVSVEAVGSRSSRTRKAAWRRTTGAPAASAKRRLGRAPEAARSARTTRRRRRTVRRRRRRRRWSTVRRG